ncbi:hypothetical protein OROGR_008429 [Orobanche gracilis]
MAAGLTAVLTILAVVTSGGFEIRLLPLDRRVPMAACDLPRWLVLDFRTWLVANPVPRVVHPDWLQKKACEKEDNFHQCKLVDMFRRQHKDDVRLSGAPHVSGHTIDEHNVTDMEDSRNIVTTRSVRPQAIVRSYGINNVQHPVKTDTRVESAEQVDGDGSRHKPSSYPLQDIFEGSIDRSVDYQGWLELRKRKWKENREKRKRQRYSFFII